MSLFTAGLYEIWVIVQRLFSVSRLPSDAVGSQSSG
jgi:hypothetical protein